MKSDTKGLPPGFGKTLPPGVTVVEDKPSRELISYDVMLRDDFAGQAMTGLILHRPTYEDPTIIHRYAGAAYLMADAMMKARLR